MANAAASAALVWVVAFCVVALSRRRRPGAVRTAAVWATVIAVPYGPYAAVQHYSSASDGLKDAVRIVGGIYYAGLAVFVAWRAGRAGQPPSPA